MTFRHCKNCGKGPDIGLESDFCVIPAVDVEWLKSVLFDVIVSVITV
jgi:hypothetical protein